MNPLFRQLLLTLALVCFSTTTAAFANIEWDTYNHAGLVAFKQAKYAEAEKLFRAGLKVAEESDSNHNDVALSLDNLARLYRTQGKYAQAEPLYKRSLAISEKALGPNHPDVAASLNNLAEPIR
jgi:tetratricopeptide (TPR) repeat protein